MDVVAEETVMVESVAVVDDWLVPFTSSFCSLRFDVVSEVCLLSGFCRVGDDLMLNINVTLSVHNSCCLPSEETSMA